MKNHIIDYLNIQQNEGERKSFRNISKETLRFFRTIFDDDKLDKVFHNNEVKKFKKALNHLEKEFVNLKIGEKLFVNIEQLQESCTIKHAKDTMKLFKQYTDTIAVMRKNMLISFWEFHELEKQIDFKTLTLTRKGFDKQRQNIFDDVKNGRNAVAHLVVFDQNDLKEINETYGHEIGQLSIWKLGEILKSVLDKQKCNYILSNYFGGDERFCVVVDKDISVVKKVFEKFFSLIEDKQFSLGGASVILSGVVGVVSFTTQNLLKSLVEKPREIIKFTDETSLHAKEKKKNTRHGNVVEYKTLEDIIKEQKVFSQKLVSSLSISQLQDLNLKELYNVRDEQIDKLIDARTKTEKKIYADNVKLLNKIIHEKGGAGA